LNATSATSATCGRGVVDDFLDDVLDQLKDRVVLRELKGRRE
jgi:hypothetical protein